MYPLTVPDLQTIINQRALHRKYFDTDIATTILGRTHKEPVTMGRNTFCQGFEQYASDEGYWNYDRMVLQLEYFSDILRDNNPGIDFIFLFDHTCGHDKGI